MERVSSDPEWLLEAPWDWRQALDVWQAGVTNRAIERAGTSLGAAAVS